MRSRQTKSEINVQTPTGLQNMEMLMNLDYDEIVLLRSINHYFENEHMMYRSQREDLLFDLVNQVLDKVADGRIPLDLEHFYPGDLENEMDHASLVPMRHLLREAGAHLFRKMYRPGEGRREKVAKAADDALATDLARLGASA